MKVYEMPGALEIQRRIDRMAMPMLMPYRDKVVERFERREVTGAAAFVEALTMVVQVMNERGEYLAPQFQRTVAMVVVATVVRDSDVVRDARSKMRVIASIAGEFFDEQAERAWQRVTAHHIAPFELHADEERS